MGVKNRQGCCCGSVIGCENSCTVCYGIYLKNGVVHDANGDHALLQPKWNVGPWRTGPIKFTTGYWTSGDCIAKTGDAYYTYTLVCNPENNGDGGSMTLRVDFSVVQCGETQWLYNGESTNLAESLSVETASGQIQCDPFQASFDLGLFNGLQAPWAGSYVTFDRDDAAQKKCACRSCLGVSEGGGPRNILAGGDVVVSYNIKDVDGQPKSGSIQLARSLPSSTDPGSQYVWTGNIDWWDRPSCSNPTNAPGIPNVYLTCGGFNFLKWCFAKTSGSWAEFLSSHPDPSSVAFNLMSTGLIKDGSGTIKDAPGTGSGNDVCCWPCSLPRVDLTATITEERRYGSPTAPPVVTVISSGTLVYSSTEYEIPYGLGDSTTKKVGHWRATGIKVRATDQTPKTMYFDCEVPYPDPSSGDGSIGVAPFVVGPEDPNWFQLSPPCEFISTNPANPFQGTTYCPAVAPATTTCDPFHLDYSYSYSGAGAFPGGGSGAIYVTKHFYFDEV